MVGSHVRGRNRAMLRGTQHVSADGDEMKNKRVARLEWPLARPDAGRQQRTGSRRDTITMFETRH
jgi:hypothetical protein